MMREVRTLVGKMEGVFRRCGADVHVAYLPPDRISIAGHPKSVAVAGYYAAKAFEYIGQDYDPADPGYLVQFFRLPA